MSATQAAYGFPTATPTAADHILIAKGMKRRLSTPADLAALLAPTVMATAFVAGTKTLHATTSPQALAVSDLGKLVIAPNTGAITVTLPAAASCTGAGFVFKKTTADAVAVTLDGNGAETIDGGATFASIDAANDCVEIISDGTGWQIVAKSIA